MELLGQGKVSCEEPLLKFLEPGSVTTALYGKGTWLMA